MSVINKMLRDLDQRAEGHNTSGNHAPSPPSLLRSTASVGSLRDEAMRPDQLMPKARILSALLLSPVVLALCWLVVSVAIERQNPRQDLTSATSDRVQADVRPDSRVAQPAALGAPPGARPIVVGGPAPVLAVAASAASGPDQIIHAQRGGLQGGAFASATVSQSGQRGGSAAKSGVQQANDLHIDRSTRADDGSGKLGLLQPIPAAPAAGAPRSNGLAEVLAPALAWQVAVSDTIGQAQRLWRAGSRDMAAEVLKDALLAMERTHAVDMAGTGSAVTLALVRELVRMELGRGQPESALALLLRHERMLAGQADLWAMRANASQRIGQHADASQAYQMALKIRPGEPRWMLGAAVSLAAQGQTGAAADLAEQARGLEPANLEVLVYLRQLGVSLRDQ